MTNGPDDMRNVALLDLLDRALAKGVVLWGDITISVADVDLIYLGVRLLLSSVDTAERMRGAAASRQLAAIAEAAQ